MIPEALACHVRSEAKADAKNRQRKEMTRELPLSVISSLFGPPNNQ